MPTPTAAYMRAYRARKKAEAAAEVPPLARPASVRRRADPRDERIAELEAEVRRLKQLLALRQPNAIGGPQTVTPRGTFNSRPFQPVPKVGR